MRKLLAVVEHPTSTSFVFVEPESDADKDFFSVNVKAVTGKNSASPLAVTGEPQDSSKVPSTGNFAALGKANLVVTLKGNDMTSTTDGSDTDLVTITGTNFGPVDSTNVAIAVYQNAGLSSAYAKGEFTARDCVVSVAHTKITCKPAEAGAGKVATHGWSMALVGASVSNFFQDSWLK